MKNNCFELHLWPGTNFSVHPKHSPFGLLASMSLLERVMVDRVPFLCGDPVFVCCDTTRATTGVGNKGIHAALVGGGMRLYPEL